MKHVGKMKNNGARVAVVYRTLPGDPHSALVVGTNGLANSYHDSMMSLIEHDSAQQAYELADILAVRRFPDGANMLEYLHKNGHLKKVPTNMVLMTPDPQTSIQLDELNQLIADQKGVSLTELSVREDSVETEATVATVKEEPKQQEVSTTTKFELTPAEMRSRADALYKEAARLRKEADALDPPKKKATKEEA